jgi:hypothetical protein
MRTALAVVAVCLAATACGGTTQHGAPTSRTTCGGPATTSSSTTTSSSSTTTSTTPVAPPAPIPPSATIGPGASGPEVLAVERRLDELGYWPGELDGSFDRDTGHAVVAIQKAAGLPRDGVIDPPTRQALDQGVRPTPRSAAGRVVEIDLQRQLLLVVVDGHLQTTFDTSTGARSTPTPRGHFKVTRQIDGLRRSKLGLLYRPKYFDRGIAIHGFTSVPPSAASHGCVRVTYHAMDRIWSAGLIPLGTAVWVR